MRRANCWAWPRSSATSAARELATSRARTPSGWSSWRCSSLPSHSLRVGAAALDRRGTAAFAARTAAESPQWDVGGGGELSPKGPANGGHRGRVSKREAGGISQDAGSTTPTPGSLYRAFVRRLPFVGRLLATIPHRGRRAERNDHGGRAQASRCRYVWPSEPDASPADRVHALRDMDRVPGVRHVMADQDPRFDQPTSPEAAGSRLGACLGFGS
jgi:hypothetical protein